MQAVLDDGSVLRETGEVRVGAELLLWAPDGTAAIAAGAPYDVVLLGLAGEVTGFGLTLAALRRAGRITDSTLVCAVGGGHRTPPADELAAVLALWGAALPRDGETVASPANAPTVRPPRALVIGGARSGKSAYAELRLLAEPRVRYVATAPLRADDPEWDARVQAHRARRPAAWTTVETGDVAAQLTSGGAVLVDDLGLWLTRLLDDHGGWTGPPPSAVSAACDELVAAWAECSTGAVLVVPDVGRGVVPATASGRLFRDLLGDVTARLARHSDEVVEVTAGLPRRLR
ncbi:MAG: hypothetical protein NVS3B26_02430 [Mycobacteriales bacterium]